MFVNNNLKAIAATTIAAIAFSCILLSCQGRKMSNMEPTGDTVEVVIAVPDAAADTVSTVPDSLHTL